MDNDTVKKTSDMSSTEHTKPSEEESLSSLPLFVTRSKRGTPSDTKSWVTTVSTHLRQWIGLHF